MARALGLWSGCSSVDACKSRCKIFCKATPLCKSEGSLKNGTVLFPRKATLDRKGGSRFRSRVVLHLPQKQTIRKAGNNFLNP